MVIFRIASTKESELVIYEKNIVKAVLTVYFIHLPIQKNFHVSTSKIVDIVLKKHDIISCETSTNKENNTSQK